MMKNSPGFWIGKLPTLLTILSLLAIVLPGAAAAAEGPILPSLSLSLAADQPAPEKVSVLLEILFLLTVLSVAPAIVLTATSFTRIIVVFSFLRQAVGTRQMPPNQILAALAIFMTVAIMLPVGKQINDTALQPYLQEEIGYKEALKNAEARCAGFCSSIPGRRTWPHFSPYPAWKNPRTNPKSRPCSCSRHIP